jgi:hypothetical protein
MEPVNEHSIQQTVKRVQLLTIRQSADKYSKQFPEARKGLVAKVSELCRCSIRLTNGGGCILTSIRVSKRLTRASADKRKRLLEASMNVTFRWISGSERLTKVSVDGKKQ